MSTEVAEFLETYYNSLYDDQPRSSRNSSMNIIRITLVVLLRVGFVLIQVGSVPVNNVNLILLQNVVDVCWTSTVYLLIGFIVAYNGDVAGMIGEGHWLGHPNTDKDEAVIGWSAVLIGSAICTCGIVGRTHTLGYLVIGLLLAGLIQPLLIHWAWTEGGWMRGSTIRGARVQIRDCAGAGVVHLVGGLSGLIGCITLGRRVLKLKEVDDASISAGSSGTVFAGQLLVFLGLQVLTVPHYNKSSMKESANQEESLPDPFINNLLAGSFSCLVVVALHFARGRDMFNHWTVMRCVQAAVSGLVAVSAGADSYSPQASILLGCVGGALFYAVSRWMFYSALEDYCNIVAVHLVSAVLGQILAPLLAVHGDEDISTILLNFSWQLICLLATLSLVSVAMTTAFVALRLFGVLRNRSEHLNHLRAMAVLDRSSGRSYTERLFYPGLDSVYLQPGSTKRSSRRASQGSRFLKYQAELDEAQQNRK